VPAVKSRANFRPLEAKMLKSHDSLLESTKFVYYRMAPAGPEQGLNDIVLNFIDPKTHAIILSANITTGKIR
jgi:hypothetical protein